MGRAVAGQVARLLQYRKVACDPGGGESANADATEKGVPMRTAPTARYRASVGMGRRHISVSDYWALLLLSGEFFLLLAMIAAVIVTSR